MNIREFSRPLPKPWLDIKANSVQTKTLSSDSFTTANISSSNVTLSDQKSVPNPASGNTTLYMGADGILRSSGSSGTVTKYSTSPNGGTENYVQIVGNADIISGIAPAGQRNLYQYGTGAIGSQMRFSSNFNMVWSSGNTSGAAYSIDGGATFAACVFNVALGGFLTIGASPTLVVAVSSTGETASSGDGINFIKGPTIAGTNFGFNIEWNPVLGLFIFGHDVSAGVGIITSPDGVTWTGRSALSAQNVKSNPAGFTVAVGGVAPYIQYSTNGTTWTSISGGVAAALRSLTWSAERSEWFTVTNAGGLSYRSSDGIIWTAGAVSPSNGIGNNLIWVGRYSRYYLSGIDSDGNYSLLSTTDPAIAFVGTHLDGAVNNTLPYSLQYDASRDRFMIAVNSSPYFAYGTPRADLKMLSDNIRVRNAPVHTDKYSTAVDVVVASTTTETDISTAGTVNGSLVYQDAQALGMVSNIMLYLVVTSAGGDTLTIRYKVNGVTHVTHPLVIPAATTNLPIMIRTNAIVRAATIQYNSYPSLSTSAAISTAPAYTRTVVNTLSITAQWGASASSCTQTGCTISTAFRNGA